MIGKRKQKQVNTSDASVAEIIKRDKARREQKCAEEVQNIMKETNCHPVVVMRSAENGVMLIDHIEFVAQ